MKALKFFVIGLLLSATPAMSSTLNQLGSVDNTAHRVLKLDEGLRKDLERDPSWQVCGDYFARRGHGDGKMVLFVFEKGPFVMGPSESDVLTYSVAEAVHPSVSRNANVLTVSINEDWRGLEFKIRMDIETYIVGFPCFSTKPGT